MAMVPSSSLQLPKPFSTPFASSSSKPHALLSPKPLLSFSVKATDSDSDSNPDTEPSTNADESSTSSQPSEPDAFDSRLAEVRLRYRSGSGKKADVRKGRKSKKSSSSSGPGVFLPPVPLKEPVSGGLKVDFGFSPYSERVNGRIAILGLGALLSVELATGQSVIRYHSPAIIFIQVYFVAAVSALYVKYEKESVSIWPESSPAKK
ncbi:uncharacterized protein LOC117927809 [Vitis riparia]|uniref:uncharacterized protein LOC117927809 n=1 Tax=Vitis riparia TaxID=96939 RepID=UPI00155AED8D|nr:uncharacterized protein LOC117927809 [Vitis riparia]